MPHSQFYYKNNRLKQLQGFLAVAALGSVSQAAKNLFLTQAAVTQQIQSLERDFGVELFNRDKKLLTLTQAGKILESLAKNPVQLLEGVFEQFNQDLQNQNLDSIDISLNHTSILYILPKILKRFRETHRHINVNIRNIPRNEAMIALDKGDTHLGIYPIMAIPKDCDFIPIINVDPILLVRKDHPLASKEDLTLHDVAKYDLVRIDPHLITLPMFEETLVNYGIGSNISFQNSDWEILKKFVAAGIGVAIISNICINVNDPVLIGRPLYRYFPEMIYGMLLKKGRYIPPQLEVFIDIARNWQNLIM